MEHHFNVNLAVRFGIEKAVIINNLYFWINHNAKNNKHVYEGRVWTFNSVSAFYKLMPYIKERTFYRYLNELEEAKVISIGNFNKSPFDKTKWYSFTEEFIEMLEVEGYDIENIAGLKATEDTPTVLPENRQHGNTTTRENELHKMANRESKSGETIPDNIPDNIPNKREKDIDKSISKSNYKQGCGTSLPPSVAPQHLSAASSGVSSPCSSDDAFAPLTFEEEEATNKGATACGVNVNPLQTPLPPTPMMSSDVDVDDADNSNAKKFKRKKYKAKFDVYADLSYVDEAYADIWREWLEYKDAINKQYNVQKGAIIQYKSLLKYADNNVILANAIVKKSIEHSWNGLFGLSDKDKELYLSERSPYYVKSNEPKLPNGWDRERYDMYIRNGFEITEDGKLYKNGKLYK